ncbi:MAG TPA: TRAM domain-containing protein [Vicinamibacterales bacterium]
MSPERGELVEIAIERPAAGGRMLGRLDGAIVLVAGAIPGERVAARLEGRRGGVLFARTVEVVEASPDRRDPGPDPACGGRDFAHIAYRRQVQLKQEILRDQFRRLARVDLPGDIAVLESPEQGYRMRARLHAHGTRFGFYREGTRELCDPACSGQLRDDALAAVAALGRACAAARLGGLRSVELSENREGTERALLLELDPERAPRVRPDMLPLPPGTTGLFVSRGGRILFGHGSPDVHDTLSLDGGRTTLRLVRHVSSFFQGNRYVLEGFVQRVIDRAPSGPITDLYAGTGLFGLAWAASGRGPVVAVEGDRISAADLHRNAEPFGETVTVRREPVERALGDTGTLTGRTVLVDPPRTGLSKEAVSALAAVRPPHILYVSCDPATLARDVSRLTSAGYVVIHVELFDLFPATAHLETLVVLENRQPSVAVPAILD